MNARVAIVLLLVGQNSLPTAPTLDTETIHGLVLPLHAGWARKEDPSGAVFLVPPQDQNPSNYALCIIPPSKLQGSHWEAHKVLVKALLEQAKWTGGEPVTVPDPEGPGIFIKTGAAGKADTGELREFTLFTAVHDGVIEAVIGINRIDRTMVDPMLKAARFKTPPPEQVRPKIVEAYRRLNQRLYNTRDGGALTAGSLMYDRLWLRSDGTADFSTTYLEGYAASPLVLKTDAGLLNGDYGSWKSVNDKIHLTRSSGGTAAICGKEKGALRIGDQVWEPMPRVDGLKLSGRWEIKSPPEEKTSPYHNWIDFTPEGRFRTDGLLKYVSSLDFDRPKPPEKGAGTYTIRDWTMFFKFDDGMAWSTDFSTLGRELKPDMSILFRTYVFPKAKE